MIRCCIKSCTYSTQQLFKFPIGNVPLLNAWLKAMDYDESFFITQETFLCSDHFKKEDLIFKNGVWNVTNKAVPSNFRFKNSNEAPSISNTFNNNKSVNITNGSKSSVDNNEVLNLDTEYEMQVWPNSVKSNFTHNTSDKNHGQGGSHQIFSAKNNNRAQISLSTLDSVKRSDGQASSLHSIRKPISHQETTLDSVLRDEDYWMLVESEYNCKIPDHFIKRMRLTKAHNKKLISKIKLSKSHKYDAQDDKINLLKLRKLILETELALIRDGIDTSKYPIFAFKFC